jgi:hypothetical protein
MYLPIPAMSFTSDNVPVPTKAELHNVRTVLVCYKNQTKLIKVQNTRRKTEIRNELTQSSVPQLIFRFPFLCPLFFSLFVIQDDHGTFH